MEMHQGLLHHVPPPLLRIILPNVGGSLGQVTPPVAVNGGWVTADGAEGAPGREEGICSLLVGQPDVESPGVQAVEEHGTDLQLGASVGYGFYQVGASQVHAHVGEGFAGDVELLLGEVPHLLLQGLLDVNSAELALLHHILGQGSALTTQAYFLDLNKVSPASLL